MSKIVTIPTDGMSPFVVTHNGEKYVFTPGETVEVSDGVALEIEEYKRWREKYYGTIDPPYEGGGDIDALIDGSLTEITSNAESVKASTFVGCNALTSVDLPKAISIGSSAFSGCAQLVSVEFPLVQTIGTYAFQSCSMLESVSFPSVTGSTGEYVFSGLIKLKSVNFPNATKVDWNSFTNCSGLTNVKFPSARTIDNQAFRSCSGLITADFPKLTKISGQAFDSCNQLTALILRSETQCTLSSTNTFTNTPIAKGTGYIYVPRALIEDYKVATNWVTFADQFRALEDYTVDGTTTGELDESKVSL